MLVLVPVPVPVPVLVPVLVPNLIVVVRPGLGIRPGHHPLAVRLRGLAPLQALSCFRDRTQAAAHR